MPSSSKLPAYRSAAELRIAFKSMAAQRLPREIALEKFDFLWDEANRAAAMLSGTGAISDYVALLKEMQDWYTAELHGPV